MVDKDNNYVLILGAGPSGLALGYELIKLNSDLKPIIIDKLDRPGGLARTIYLNQLGIDIGGHRLFTKNKYVEQIWKSFFKIQSAPSIDDLFAHRKIKYSKAGADPNISDDVLLIRKRFSSIFKNGKLFKYPFSFSFDTFKKLGCLNSINALYSFIKAKIFKSDSSNIEGYLINRFGKFIYELFFKKHSEKIWGVKPFEIINEWDKTRFGTPFLSLPKIWTDEYYYPKFGCSQLWDKMAEYITNNGGKILYNCEFKDFEIKYNKIISAIVLYNNQEIKINAKYFASSIALSDLIKAIDAPFDIKQYALNLPYRDYIMVSFYTNSFNLSNYTKFKTYNDITPDSWVYLQEDNTIASRMQIMNNWSPYLIDDYKNRYIISFEYFCNKDDDLWKKSDNDLINIAFKDCQIYNLFERDSILKTFVLRQEKAYPAYFGSYKHIAEIRKHIGKFDNLYIMGRNGEHKYINMDSAMFCGINIARDILKRDIK